VTVPDTVTSTITIDRSERSSELEIEFSPGTRIDPEQVSAPPRAPGAILRRAATEARDRVQPLRTRFRQPR
jgi:hypothetical protein